jgi:hypothetical protein
LSVFAILVGPLIFNLSKDKKKLFGFPIFRLWAYLTKIISRIGGVMVSVLASSAVDREFELLSGQIKNHEIGISCFSTKHAALSNFQL